MAALRGTHKFQQTEREKADARIAELRKAALAKHTEEPTDGPE